MLAKIYSVASIGLETITVEVEVNAGRGEPHIHIVGLPNKAVQESEERVKTALVNCGVKFPAKRVTINLAPADVPKEGPIFDLPIALGILQAFEIIEIDPEIKPICIGELSLNGSVRKVKGVLPFVLHSQKHHFNDIVIPAENREEVNIISGIRIHPIDHIMQLIEHFSKKTSLPILEAQSFQADHSAFEIDFADVHGQEQAKRAMEIAAAGGHNVLLNGSPGSGKSMLARAFISILPPLTEREAIEITNIYSVAGLARGLIRSRPFRAPHHTTSQVGLIGGGTKLKPGEVSLSHRGVLFLDEFPEFSHFAIESLRQPLEDHIVQISRASGSTIYPAQFTLVAAANPCPCGYLYSKTHSCICNSLQIERYQKKLSGPILDRIDLHVYIQEVPLKQLAEHHPLAKESSGEIRNRVIAARERQYARYKDTRFLTNSELTSQAVKKFCTMTEEARKILHQGAEKFGLSARSYFKIIKVAQTIVDLETDNPLIEAKHIAEALQYRVSPKE